MFSLARYTLPGAAFEDHPEIATDTPHMLLVESHCSIASCTLKCCIGCQYVFEYKLKCYFFDLWYQSLYGMGPCYI